MVNCHCKSLPDLLVLPSSLPSPSSLQHPPYIHSLRRTLGTSEHPLRTRHTALRRYTQEGTSPGSPSTLSGSKIQGPGVALHWSIGGYFSLQSSVQPPFSPKHLLPAPAPAPAPTWPYFLSPHLLWPLCYPFSSSLVQYDDSCISIHPRIISPETTGLTRVTGLLSTGFLDQHPPCGPLLPGTCSVP